MTTDTAIHLAQQALDVAVRLSVPLLAVALVVGLVIGVFQAATQIQEMTLVMVPKLAAMAIVAVLAGPWMLDQLVGSSAAIMNLELRFPIITELQVGFLGSFPPVDAVLFFDGGMAWENAVCLSPNYTRVSDCPAENRRDVRLVWDRQGADPYLVREPLFSWGVGLRFNVFYTVLRLDYAFPLDRPDRRGRFTVSFGPSF